MVWNRAYGYRSLVASRSFLNSIFNLCVTLLKQAVRKSQDGSCFAPHFFLLAMGLSAFLEPNDKDLRE
jgi:hypothetical protein